MEKTIESTITTSPISSVISNRGEEFLTKFKEILMGNLEWAENEEGRNTLLGQGDSVDQYNAEKEKVLHLRLKGRNDLYIKKVKEALRRIELKTFGECQDCGAEISEKRLLARPTAELCINCKEHSESEENQTLDKNKFSAKISKTDNLLHFKNINEVKSFSDEIA